MTNFLLESVVKVKVVDSKLIVMTEKKTVGKVLSTKSFYSDWNNNKNFILN